jgi:Acyl-CoA synthetases (AMP-forming)/AMP-acid ligases II
MWNFKQFSKNIAIIDELGIRLTYAEFENRGDRLCDAVGQRCLVFNMCDNVLGSILGYASFLNHHIVPAMLKHDLDKDLFQDLYNAYKPKYIWAPKTLKGSYSDCKAVYEDAGYILFKTPFGDAYPINDEIALLLTTSGSTGSPKFVRQSYANIRANTDSIVQYLHLDETERPITTLPMNYTYGISIINSHLDVGATILLTTKTLMQKEFWSFFRAEKATSFGGVPYTYEMLKRLRFFRMDIPSLKTMTQAGGKLLPELHKEFAQYAIDTGREFIVMYGQCEATARMGYLPSDKSLNKFGSMGIAIPGGKFELIDVDGKVINEPDVTGELVYYGSNVTLGYALEGKDLIKGDENHGKLVTGDMAKRDKDGFYFIVGRKKRFLKIYGNRVNLDEIERIVKAAFEGIECACGGIDDKMYIFITDTSKIDEVRHFVSNKTGLNQAAFVVRYINEVPKNDSGKTLYRELENHYD